ncbi:hypothetical protein DSCW_07560 [Desulfosarcina widdelii]|uniref:Uncharacterized protein n=1 Tax=Desulfosarcina widdelii TaxID=947919 RepID=A0A5K7YZC4_9BACT|nr:hypothetical protein [Desulfosarcina widdelii]BBO73339.1 hypothetical protein DSCW_07560 [Desulfosarcina widdelii]
MKSTKENHLIDDFDLMLGFVKALTFNMGGEESEYTHIILHDVLDKLDEFKEIHLDPWQKKDFPVHP